MLGESAWHGVGEVEAAGLVYGLEGARSATCRHGRDLDGFLVLAEDWVDRGGRISIILGPSTIHGSALGFHGFQDGGGLIHNIGIGNSMDIPTGFRRLTYPIEEGE
jgi:hypothetical protein